MTMGMRMRMVEVEVEVEVEVAEQQHHRRQDGGQEANVIEYKSNIKNNLYTNKKS